jgi:hypothetical protein
MANALYPLWKQQLLQFTANNNLSTGTVKVALIDTSFYTYSDAHQFWSSVSGSAVVGTPATLGSKTYTNGVFDAADVTFNTVTGASVEALIIYIDTGTAGTSPLVAYIDSSVTGLPVTPNGGNISIAWSSGPPAGIFSL